MNINEKLSLKKKTVVVLNDSQMRAIQGGGNSLGMGKQQHITVYDSFTDI